MKKTILITGATDGIGLETAKELVSQGHNVLLHGRNPDKLKTVHDNLQCMAKDNNQIASYLADLSDINSVLQLADAVLKNHHTLDVLINNAGIFRTDNNIASNGLDVRFVVNMIAPYVLTRQLKPLMSHDSRVVNVSSAAQAPINLDAFAGHTTLEAMEAYAQSKLAITLWTHHAAPEYLKDGIVMVAVKPGSLLQTKMVKEGFGIEGSDIRIGSEILVLAALSEEFSDAAGKYFDNDGKQFAPPHAEVFDHEKYRKMMVTIDRLLTTIDL